MYCERQDEIRCTLIGYRDSFLMFGCVGLSGRLADHLLVDILQEKLNSKPCKNQGFVLDGFPKTYEQAKLIFSGKVQPFI